MKFLIPKRRTTNGNLIVGSILLVDDIVYSPNKYRETEGTKVTHDPTTLISAAVDLDHKKLYIYSELYEHGLITSQIADEVRKLKLHKAKIMADGAEPRLIAELKESYALNISGAPKPRGSIIQGIDFIKGFDIVVHPSCEHTIEEFETYAFKQDKLTGKYTNVPVDDNNHLIDALRYALTPYHIKSKPKQDKRKKTQMLKQFGL